MKNLDQPSRIFQPFLALLLGLTLTSVGCDGEKVNPEGNDLQANVMDVDGDGVLAAVDCNDNDPLVYQLLDGYADVDGDGFGAGEVLKICSAEDLSPLYAATGDDPDDELPNVTPLNEDGDSALKVDDCDDLDPSIQALHTYYVDADADGYGSVVSEEFCLLLAPLGYAGNSDDPNDGNSNVVPEDADGDFVINAKDCAPEDPSRYEDTLYFVDSDGDGLGTGDGENFCTSIPAEIRSGYSLVGGDSCPDLANREMDWDQDGLDDVCDRTIEVTETIRLAGTYYSPRVTHQIGFPGSYATITFRNDATLLVNRGAVVSASPDTILAFVGGADLVVADNSDLVFEENARLEMTRTGYDDPVSLRLGQSGLSSFDTKGVKIKGINHRHWFMLQGVDITVGDKVVFDGIHHLWFRKIELENPVTREKEFFGTSLYQQNLYVYDFRHEIEDELRIINSPGQSAVVVDYYWIDLKKVHFENNHGYPLTCRGEDYLETSNERGIRRRLTTCQHALTFAYYEGNRLNGVLLRTRMYDEGVLNVALNRFRPSESFVDLQGAGTEHIYIAQPSFGVSSTDNGGTGYSVSFEDVTLHPSVEFSFDENGLITGTTQVVSPGNQNGSGVLEIHGHSFANRTAKLFFYNSNLKDIKPVVIGGEMYVDNSVVGPIHLGDGYTQGASPSLRIENSVLDFSTSLHEGVIVHDYSAEILARCGILFDNREERSSAGYATISDSTIRNSAGTSPLCAISDTSLESNVRLTGNMVLENADPENLWTRLGTNQNHGGFRYR